MMKTCPHCNRSAQAPAIRHQKIGKGVAGIEITNVCPWVGHDEAIVQIIQAGKPLGRLLEAWARKAGATPPLPRDKTGTESWVLERPDYYRFRFFGGKTYSGTEASRFYSLAEAKETKHTMIQADPDMLGRIIIYAVRGDQTTIVGD